MLDLFGDEVTSPSVAPPKGLLNATLGFPEFWAAWPSGPRKVAKQQCLNKWTTHECAQNYQHIVMHVEWMKTQADWQKDGGSFVPMPVTYLNQQRWIDWVAPKAVPVQESPLQKILAHKGAPMPTNVKQRLAELRQQMRA